MARRIVRNLEKLSLAESIEGIHLSDIDKLCIEKTISRLNSIHSIEIGSNSEFSKPKVFFTNHHKFVYIRDGKQIPYMDINMYDRYFIAYQLRNQKMYIFGYFPGETD